jgi:NACalpha-BTF3-like transcription factor
LEFYKREPSKITIRDSKGNKIDGVGFSEEDIELIAQQTGVDKKRAKKALVDAKGDVAKAILLLNSE